MIDINEIESFFDFTGKLTRKLELKKKKREDLASYYRTLESIGEEMSIGKERVRQLEERALEKLRSPKNLRLLKPFLFRI